MGSRENTLPAIAAGVAAGADLVEVDVRLTADGTPVLLHDSTLERLWGDPRPVESVPLADLRRIGAGEGWQIPTLDEAMDMAEDLDTELVLDVTRVPFGVAADKAVHERRLEHRVIFCGDPETLAEIRQRSPRVRIALTWRPGPLPDRKLWERVRPQFFNPEGTAVTEQVVTAMHDAGLRVCTWTIDREADMRALLDIGVDAIISNRIATLVRVNGAMVAAEGDRT